MTAPRRGLATTVAALVAVAAALVLWAWEDGDSGGSDHDVAVDVRSPARRERVRELRRLAAAPPSAAATSDTGAARPPLATLRATMDAILRATLEPYLDRTIPDGWRAGEPSVAVTSGEPLDREALLQVLMAHFDRAPMLLAGYARMRTVGAWAEDYERETGETAPHHGVTSEAWRRFQGGIGHDDRVIEFCVAREDLEALAMAKVALFPEEADRLSAHDETQRRAYEAALDRALLAGDATLVELLTKLSEQPR